MTPDEFLIDEAARETFPASDAPSWTPTHAGAAARHPKMGPAPVVRRRVRADIEALSLAIDERRGRVGGLAGLGASANFVADAFLEAGRSVTRIPLPASPGVEVLESAIRGVEDGDIVIGAHYDSLRLAGVEGSTDVSGIIVLLALARHLEDRRFAKTVRLVAFADAPSSVMPPDARTPLRFRQGARVYARRLREHRAPVVGMISLEELAFAGAERHRMNAPASRGWLSPWNGDFAAVIGNIGSRRLAATTGDALRVGMHLPVRTLTIPGFLPLASSPDQRSFWREGFSAVMISDQGPLHARRGHGEVRDAQTLGHDQMADLVFGLGVAVARLAGGDVAIDRPRG